MCVCVRAHARVNKQRIITCSVLLFMKINSFRAYDPLIPFSVCTVNRVIHTKYFNINNCKSI